VNDLELCEGRQRRRRSPVASGPSEASRVRTAHGLRSASAEPIGHGLLGASVALEMPDVALPAALVTPVLDVSSGGRRRVDRAAAA
jgi:hypothetical protein